MEIEIRLADFGLRDAEEGLRLHNVVRPIDGIFMEPVFVARRIHQ